VDMQIELHSAIVYHKSKSADCGQR
jgi:hypothetical protein